MCGCIIWHSSQTWSNNWYTCIHYRIWGHIQPLTMYITGLLAWDCCWCDLACCFSLIRLTCYQVYQWTQPLDDISSNLECISKPSSSWNHVFISGSWYGIICMFNLCSDWSNILKYTQHSWIFWWQCTHGMYESWSSTHVKIIIGHSWFIIQFSVSWVT